MLIRHQKRSVLWMPRRSFLVWEMLLRQLCTFAKLYDTNLYLRAMMLSSSGGDPRMQRLGAIGPGRGCQHVGCSQHLECSWIFAAYLHNLHCALMGCTLLCEKKLGPCCICRAAICLVRRLDKTSLCVLARPCAFPQDS